VVDIMTPIQTKRALRADLLLAAVMVISGGVIAVASVAQIQAHDPQVMAQATQPLQSTPGAASKPSEPAEPATTGARPHDIPPQPARPDQDAQDTGAKPALPPAPAEKTAPPIPTK
jgi:hypothetical protein